MPCLGWAGASELFGLGTWDLELFGIGTWDWELFGIGTWDWELFGIGSMMDWESCNGVEFEAGGGSGGDFEAGDFEG